MPGNDSAAATPPRSCRPASPTACCAPPAPASRPPRRSSSQFLLSAATAAACFVGIALLFRPIIPTATTRAIWPVGRTSPRRPSDSGLRPMKQRFFVAIATALVFCAGYLAGLWTEQHRPLPAAPRCRFLRRIHRPNGQPDTRRPRQPPVNRADCRRPGRVAAPRRSRPSSSAIAARSTTSLSRISKPILTPEQRGRHAKELADERSATATSRSADESRPLTDDAAHLLLREQPSRSISNDVVILAASSTQQTNDVKFRRRPARQGAGPPAQARRDRFLDADRQRAAAQRGAKPPGPAHAQRLAQPVTGRAGPGRRPQRLGDRSRGLTAGRCRACEWAPWCRAC